MVDETGLGTISTGFNRCESRRRPGILPSAERQPSELFAQLYRDVHAIAAACLRCERIGHTLQPTALTHEIYLRMRRQRLVKWSNHEQFLAVAARVARRILIDHARARAALKRRGARDARPIDLDEPAKPSRIDRWHGLVSLDDALSRLSVLHDRQARVVEMRVFGGLTNVQVALALGISRATVANDWAAARAWLSAQIGDEPRE